MLLVAGDGNRAFRHRTAVAHAIGDGHKDGQPNHLGVELVDMVADETHGRTASDHFSAHDELGFVVDGRLTRCIAGGIGMWERPDR
jgi:hypothetical protein